MSFPHVTYRLTIPALSYGPEIEAMRGEEGALLAVVGEAVYLESRSGRIAAIVGANAPNSPLSLRLPELQPVAAAPAGGSGQTFRWSADRLVVGDHLSISFEQARRWEPATPNCIAARPKRTEAAQALARAATGQHATLVSGVVALTLGHEQGYTRHTDDPVAASLLDYLAKTREVLRSGEASVEPVAAMLGLGPGLTPSGDDVAAGLLAALAWRAALRDLQAGPAAMLAEAILTAAQLRTNRISMRLLHYACRGTLYEPAMQLGAALLAGDTVSAVAHVPRVLSIGATSGADLVAGLVFGALVKIPHRSAS